VINIWLAIWALVARELIRFTRQPSRVVGILASPMLFWILIGSGLKYSFQTPQFASDMDYLEYFFPGTLVLIVMFTAIFGTISLIEDRREGFLQSVLVAPIPRSSIVFGKVTGVSLLALMQGALFLLLSPSIGISLTIGMFLNAVGVLFLLAFALSSLGFATAWNMESSQGFHAIMNLCLIPMWMLSGALFPIGGAAGWVRLLMKANPLMYGVAAVRSMLYTMPDECSSDLPPLPIVLGITFAFGAITFLIAVVSAAQKVRK
jgi:ABC-2 type transport system permease protein